MLFSQGVQRALRSLLLAGAISASAVTQTTAATDADVNRLMTLLVGEYSNKPQVTQAATALKPAARGHLARQLTEVHHMFAVDVPISGMAGRTAYIEWRHDDAAGDISGQRVWVFTQTADGIHMRFHTLKPSAKNVLSGSANKTAEGAQKRRDAAKLSLADLNTYPAPCEFVFKPQDGGFFGELTKNACSFNSFSANRVDLTDFLHQS